VTLNSINGHAGATMNRASTDRAVVVGVRGKQDELLDYARDFARLVGARLRVVHSYAPPYSYADLYISKDVADPFLAAAEDVMADARTHLDEAGDVEFGLIHGYPPAALVSESHDAKAVIIATDDVGWFDRVTGSAVSRHVALHADCPVIVVPPSVSTCATTAIAIAIDGETPARGPLQFAFELADKADADLRVIHVMATNDDRESHELQVAEVLSGWLQEYPGVTVTPEIWAGDPVDETVRAAADAGMLVVGKPHAGHRHLPGRGVATSLLKVAAFPIAVVPADYGA
jgi:nucleotide-binding universal stress UspA family protein